MQLFIISPILVYFVHRFKKTAFIALVASILGSIGYTLTVFVNNNILLLYATENVNEKKKQTKLKRDNFFHSKEPGYNEVYYSTHIRFPSWLIGFIVGYILLEYPKGSIHIPKVGFFNTRIPVRNNFYFYLSVCFRKRIFVH